MMQKPGTFVKPLPALGLLALAVLLASGVFQGLWGAADLAPSPSRASVQALGLATAGLLILAWRLRWDRDWAEPGFLARLSLGGFAVLSLGLILSQRLGRVDGRLYAWVEDDVLVSMQHARHWVTGQGLVWNVGERVQGFSDPLWTLILGGAVALLPRDLAPLLPLLLNVALGLLGILALRRLARALGAAPLPAALAMAGFGLSFELVYAAFSGLETVAMAALSAVALADLAEARANGVPAPWRPLILAGALGLLRIDGLLPAVLILALARPGQSWGRRLGSALCALGPALAWLLFSRAYYGAWLPTSVTLKSGLWDGRLRLGLLYALRVLYHAKWAWALGLLAWAESRLRPWALLLAVLLAYSLLTGGDLYPGTRYLAPAWPLLWALPAAALSLRWPRGRVAALAMAGAALFSYHALWAFPGLMQGGAREAMDRIQAAQAIQRQVHPGEKVAATWAGSFFYYSDAAGVDILGKCDPVVARAPVDPDLPATGHNRLDLSHSLGELKPDWVITVPPGLPLADPWMHTVYDRKLWEDPLFAGHCRANAVPVAGPWLLCRCRWP
jgi:hypothetical protein